MAGESWEKPTDFIFLFIIRVFFFMIRVDPSPVLFYFYFFIRSELVRVDPSWSDPDWRSELIRSDFCTCLNKTVSCKEIPFLEMSCTFVPIIIIHADLDFTRSRHKTMYPSRDKYWLRGKYFEIKYLTHSMLTLTWTNLPVNNLHA